MPRWMNKTQASKELGCSRETLEKYIKNGLIKSAGVSPNIRVDVDSFGNMGESNSHRPQESDEVMSLNAKTANIEAQMAYEVAVGKRDAPEKMAERETELQEKLAQYETDKQILDAAQVKLAEKTKEILERQEKINKKERELVERGKKLEGDIAKANQDTIDLNSIVDYERADLEDAKNKYRTATRWMGDFIAYFEQCYPELDREMQTITRFKGRNWAEMIDDLLHHQHNEANRERTMRLLGDIIKNLHLLVGNLKSCSIDIENKGENEDAE